MIKQFTGLLALVLITGCNEEGGFSKNLKFATSQIDEFYGRAENLTHSKKNLFKTKLSVSISPAHSNNFAFQDTYSGGASKYILEEYAPGVDLGTNSEWLEARSNIGQLTKVSDDGFWNKAKNRISSDFSSDDSTKNALLTYSDSLNALINSASTGGEEELGFAVDLMSLAISCSSSNGSDEIDEPAFKDFMEKITEPFNADSENCIPK